MWEWHVMPQKLRYTGGEGRGLSFLHLDSLLFCPFLNTLPPHLCALTVLLSQCLKAAVGGSALATSTAAASVQLSNREIRETHRRETVEHRSPVDSNPFCL